MVLELGYTLAEKSKLANTFSLAQKPAVVFDLIVDISTGNIVKKGVNMDFRKPTGICNFNQLSGDLEQEEVISLLMSVKEGEMTLSDMAKEAAVRKKVRIIQRFMIADLDVDSWEDLISKYPQYGTPNSVNQWIQLAKQQSAFTKSGNRPIGWDEWIRKITSSGAIISTPVIDRSNESFKHFAHSGSTYDLHLADVRSLQSLFGRNKRDFRKF